MNAQHEPAHPSVQEWRLLIKENRMRQERELFLAQRVSELEIENTRLKSIIAPSGLKPRARVKQRLNFSEYAGESWAG